MEKHTDKHVVIEHGATGYPGVHGPYDTEDEAQDVCDNWVWSRWTKEVEVGTLASPPNAAYANSRPGWSFNDTNIR